MKKFLVVQNQGKITYGSSLRSYPLFIEACLFVAIGIKHLSFVISDTLPAILALEMCFITELSN